MRRLTIKDIAKEFRVSISTVSKSLNDSYEISKSTKKKIQDYAKIHNYRPNINALRLKNKQTKTIGVIIPSLLNYFYVQAFNGIEKTANEKGYKIILCVTNESFRKEVETIEILSNGGVDGFILSIAEETIIKNNYTHFKNALDDRIPILMFDRITHSLACDKVVTDNFDSVRKTVSYLVKLGHKNIAFISTLDNLEIGRERKLGYLKGLEDHNIKVNKNLIINVDKNYKNYKNILDPIFRENTIDGAITTDEASAISAMKVAILQGYKIPKNFSIISFSNGILARHSSPTLTTVSQHGETMGSTAAEILIKRLKTNYNTKKKFETITVKTDLIIRDSTKKI